MNKQIEQIRAEIERQAEKYQDTYTDMMRDALLAFIDSLPDEKPEDFNDAFDKYMKEEWSHGTQLNDIAQHFYELGQQGKIPTSKDLGDAAEKKYPVYWKEYPKDGIVRSESYYDTNKQCRDAFVAGAKWQKEQMMKDAVERVVKVDAGGYPYIDTTELYDYEKDKPLAKAGDKVKLIVIKEENEK